MLNMYDLSVLQTICSQTYRTKENLMTFLKTRNITYQDMSSYLVVGKRILIPLETHIVILSEDEPTVRLHTPSDTALSRIESYLINE